LSHQGRITLWRSAALAILINGVLDALGVLLRGTFITPSANAAGDAFVQWAGGPTLVPAYLIVIGGTAIGTFGYCGLWPAIGTRLAAWGALLAALGYQFLLALLGVLISFHAFAALGGQAGAAAAAAAFAGPAGGALQALSGLNFIGSILLAVAIWRSTVRPRWAGIPLAIAPFLLAFPVTLPSELLGCLLLMLAGAAMLWGTADVQAETGAAEEPSALQVSPR
jgi:hypothetical protein